MASSSFQNIQTSPLRPLGQSMPNIACLGRGTKVYINGPGHMTKMAARTINTLAKTFKNLVLQKQKAYDLETCGIRVLTSSRPQRLEHC